MHDLTYIKISLPWVLTVVVSTYGLTNWRVCIVCVRENLTDECQCQWWLTRVTCACRTARKVRTLRVWTRAAGSFRPISYAEAIKIYTHIHAHKVYCHELIFAALTTWLKIAEIKWHRFVRCCYYKYYGKVVCARQLISILYVYVLVYGFRSKGTLFRECEAFQIHSLSAHN